MTDLSLSRSLAIILVLGHMSLFFFGLLVAVFGRLELSDSVQMILMGSPLLVVVATSGFIHVLNKRNIPLDDKRVDPAVALFLQIVVSGFIVALFIIYAMGLFRTEHILSADGIKIAVGLVETALGGYIATIKDKLFITEE